jgi:hypothetical protein
VGGLGGLALGHNHLGVLPSSKKWRTVVELLEGGAPDDAVIAASALAAERDLTAAANDAVFVECVRLLAMVPVAARETDFGRALRDLGIPAADAPDLLSITAAVGEHLDRFVRQQRRASDFGELSRRALLGSITRLVGDQLPGLFAATAEETRTAFRKLSGSANFSLLARSFFSGLLSQTLSYWLDRTLSTHVGDGKRFAHVGERAGFDIALDQYSLEATRIIKEFTGGWYGKTLHRDGAITTVSATVFGAVALKKTLEELKLKRGLDA